MTINKNGLYKLAAVVFAIATAAVSCIMLDRWLEFNFFYREQNQLFLFDWQDILSKSGSIGGLALVLSMFFVQFFKVPSMGAVLTAAIGLLAAIISWDSVRKKGALVEVSPLSFLPVFLQQGALSDLMYLYQGYIAFFLAVLFFWIYSRFLSERGPSCKVLWGTVLSVLLYWIAGPVALLFSVCVLVLEAVSRNRKWFFAFVPVVAVLACSWISVRLGAIQEMRMSLLQDYYYEQLLHPGFYIYSSWIALPLVLLFQILSKGLKGQFARKILMCLAMVLSLAALLRIPKHIDRKDYDMLRLNHYENVGDWDSIISDRTSSHRNYLMMNVRNLALSHKGQLLDRLFDFPQSGIMSLIAQDEHSLQNTDVTILDSDLYYQMGNVAHSQNMAFDSSVGVRFGCPPMMMRLIRTNIVMGAYGVAEKYISTMEKTWGYKKEASSMRRFLGDDEAILSDPDLGRLRRCIIKEDHFVGVDSHRDLELILEANPEDVAARDYYLAFMLLAKDMEGIKEYIETDPKAYDGQGNLNVHLQEAVLVYAEEDENYCREHGVTETVFTRYKAFKKKFLELGANNGDPVTGLKSFSDTFWYYFMFQKI